MKILIIEDDEKILSLLRQSFEEENYIVDTALRGDDAEYLALENSYDVIISDWMLPKKSGIEILESIRKIGNNTPLIMLTAKDEVKNKIEGLKCGADDYLAKPFNFEELKARVEALHRRVSQNGLKKITIGNIIIDTDNKTVLKDDVFIDLSAKEYELFIFLVKNKNSYVSKFMIEDQLWSSSEFLSSNVIEVTIYNLRKKLKKNLIKNFKGLGYKIQVK